MQAAQRHTYGTKFLLFPFATMDKVGRLMLLSTLGAGGGFTHTL